MLSDLPLVSLLIFLPLIGVLFVLSMDEPNSLEAESSIIQKFYRNVWSTGILVSGATFLLALILLGHFRPSQEEFQFVEKATAVGPLKMFYYVGLDGVSLLFVLLTTLLTPLALIASIPSIKKRVRAYVGSFLFLETMMLGTFCSLDMFFFYIFFEGVLLPMFLIIGIWGGERRIYATFKFFLYTFLGSVLMLIAMIIMAQEVGSTAIPLLQTYMFDPSLQLGLWVAFFASFAIKMPMWPFHTWLPDAHVEAPTAGSVILAGILLKMGGYGFLRFSLPMFPEACQFFAPWVYGLSVVAVIYTSMVALVQTDMKKLIAYSSVAHMGIVTFGLFSFNHQGVAGSIFQMLSHGIVSAALFLCVGVLYDRLHTRDIAHYGGVARPMPLYAIGFMVFTFASIGLPGTSGFIGEVLVMIAAFEKGIVWALTLGTGMVLGAAYGLSLYRRVMLEKLEKEEIKKLKDLKPMEIFVFIPLLLLTLVFGIYGKPILGLMEKSVQGILRPYTGPLAVTDTQFDFIWGDGL